MDETVQRITTVHADCLEYMQSMAAESIDLTLTSPPYDDLRKYGQAEWRWEEDQWKPIIEQIYRITKRNGVVVWIVSDATIDGSETGTSFKQALWAKECGFNLHDTMIWNKGGFSAAGSLQVRYAPVFEYMFVFSKGAPKTFNPIKDRPNKHSGSVLHGTVRQADGGTTPVSGAGEKRIGSHGQRFNVWLAPGEMSNARRSHPAPFPEHIARDHVWSWSSPGDVVFDPFMGSGTTGVASRDMGRSFIGVEICHEYHAFAAQRINASGVNKEMCFG